MTDTIGQYIGGTWSGADPDFASVNPARPAEEVARVAAASGNDVDDAFTAAADAQAAWRAVPAPARGQIIRRAAALVEEQRTELELLVTRDQGKTLAEAKGELSRTIETLSFHAAQVWAPVGEEYASSKAAEEIRVVRLPIGVVSVVTPFNFPLVIAAWKIAPALAHGDTVVWKPAEAAPAAPAALMRIFEQAGLPAGVLNLVQGGGEVGAAVAAHEGADAVTFTGSVPVGQQVAAAAFSRGIRCQVELGGHNAAIVFADADIAQAARECATGAMLGAGQKCTSTRRLIVDRDIVEPFVDALHREIDRLHVADGQQPDADLGPVISGAARERILAAVEHARSEGAEVVTGGQLDLDVESRDGYFVRPTVLTGVRPTFAIAQQEVFGPVTSVIVADGDDDAFAIANSTAFGLSTSVFTKSIERIRRAVADVDVGVLHVNNQTTGAEPHVPFGGRRASTTAGSPHEQGATAREFYTWTKTVYGEP